MLLSYYNIIIVHIIHGGEKFEALKKSAYRKHLATGVNGARRGGYYSTISKSCLPV